VADVTLDTAGRRFQLELFQAVTKRARRVTRAIPTTVAADAPCRDPRGDLVYPTVVVTPPITGPTGGWWEIGSSLRHDDINFPRGERFIMGSVDDLVESEVPGPGGGGPGSGGKDDQLPTGFDID